MQVILLLSIGGAMVVSAFYMIFLHRLTRNGASIEIKKLSVEKKVESARFAWFEWYVVEVEYSTVGRDDIQKKIGPDRRSSYFGTLVEATDFVELIRGIAKSKITPFGGVILMDRLPRGRLNHYVSIMLAGWILIILAILVKKFIY